MKKIYLSILVAGILYLPASKVYRSLQARPCACTQTGTSQEKDILPPAVPLMWALEIL